LDVSFDNDFRESAMETVSLAEEFLQSGYIVGIDFSGNPFVTYALFLNLLTLAKERTVWRVYSSSSKMPTTQIEDSHTLFLVPILLCY
jgi:phosphoenolpyruvate carboxylase